MQRILTLLLVLFIASTAWSRPAPHERRSGYTVRAVLVPVAEGDTAQGYLLTPRGRRPRGGWPAVVCLHDHGAHYTIGRDKCVHPLKGDTLTPDAEAWAKRIYSGMFVGDSLAKAGYMVLTIDARYWGSRSSQLKQRDYWESTGKHWADLITKDDVASVDYLTRVRGINKERIGCFGFSMGAFRAWQLAAVDPRIRTCVASHWMTTLDANRRNDSWLSMQHEGMDKVEFGTIAGSIAPRALMLQYGQQDHLFPVESVYKAIDLIQYAYQQYPEAIFVPCAYPTDHVFTPRHWTDLLYFLKKTL